jgi:choloylglycine hydrolase
MDWNHSLPTSLFVFQSGLEKSALEEIHPLLGPSKKNPNNWTWKSDFESVVAMVGVTGNFAASDGLNSKGLMANVLYAKDSNYAIENNSNTKQLSVLRWVQYVLDKFATTKDVVRHFENNQIEIMPANVPGSKPKKAAALHLSVSDKSGESAIFEVYKDSEDAKPTYHIYYSGKLEGKTDVICNVACNVMTNEPSFDIQLKLNDYWLWQWSEKNDFPSRTIPGGPFPSDRFERATFYYNGVSSASDMVESLSQSKSIVANASVPIGTLGFKDHPNIAPTIWSTLANHNDCIYYFGNARTPNLINIDMKKLDYKYDTSELPVVTLLENNEFINESYEGCVNDNFQEKEAKSDDPFRVIEYAEISV